MFPSSCCPRQPRIHRSTGKLWPLRISQNRYRLDVVVKDVNGDRTGSWSHAIVIPDFSEDKLSSSTLIIADQMEPVATKNVGTGNFVIGTTKVRAAGRAFRRQAHRVQTSAEDEFLDAGIQSQRRRKNA